MPIKLNLLAEAQAAEDQRRKDPVKRAIWIGAFVVLGMLLWSALLYWEAAAAKSEQQRYELTWKDLETRYLALEQDKKFTSELAGKITALERYSTNRFLWGSTLNAVQQTIPPNLAGTIQITRLNGSHSYQITSSIPPKPGKNGAKGDPGMLGSSTERIVLTIEARDYGNPAEQNFNNFKKSFLNVPYFKSLLTSDAILLKSVGRPVKDLAANKEYAAFTFECQFPPTARNE